MIKKSRVKYLGVAAAALLAVAPAVTTAVSPAFAGNNISIAQAADTATGVNGEFQLKVSANRTLINSGTKIYTDTALTKQVTGDGNKATVNFGENFLITGVYIQDGTTTALQITDGNGKDTYGWVASDTTALYSGANYDLATPTKYYKIADGSVFNAKQVKIDSKGQASFIADDGKTTAKPTEITPNNPLSEPADSSYITPNNGSAQIYTDAATTINSTNPATMTKGATVVAVVKNGDKIVAYKLANNQYVKSGDVTVGKPDVGSYYEDPNILDSKSEVVASGSTAQIYSDNTTQNKVDGKTIDNKTPQKVLAYVRPVKGATAVALKIGDNQYVKVSDIKYVTDASAGLTTDTDVPANKSIAKTKGTDKVQVYSDAAATQAMDGNSMTPGQAYKVIGIVSDADGNVVSYMLAPGQYVKAGDVNVSSDGSSTGDFTEFLETGSVTVNKDATVYSDNDFGTAEDTKITKGQTINYTSVLKDSKGKILGYGFKNGDHTSYIKAGDTGDVADTNLTITVVPAGTLTVDSGSKAVKVYEDAATTKDSGATLDTSYNTWTVTRTAKNSDGKVVAYDLGNNQWVKASTVTEGATTSKAVVSNLPTGTALYSNFMGAQIYSDPDTTKTNGYLNTSYDEWSAFKVAKDAYGNPVAYELGSNQWVRASDLQLQKNLNGTFDANAGTALYSADGSLTGTITTSGLYKVFAVTYINGHQAVKLGNDSQWIIAATGDYYPA
ncbi:MAG: hypothetical protein LKF36_10455 [Lactobacillus sp.]|jgi:biotin carboxyl carrier protein|nr:hypothetical protein [Lactobacillus sp.]